MEFEFKDMKCKCASCGKWIKWLSKDEKNLIKLKLNSIYGVK